MNNSFSTIFGAIIVFILFLIYAITLGVMINEVTDCGNVKDCAVFNPGVIYVVTTIGGLVSAVVIAKLAITPPGNNPALFMSTSVAGKREENKIATNLAYVYLIGWVLIGLSALVVGVMVYPEANKTIGDIGTTWLGLAVAAGFSYFNIQPE